MTAQTKLSAPQLLEPIDLSLPLDSGDLLIQVTDPTVFAQAHIDGAVLLPPAHLCSGIQPAVGKLPDLDSLHGALAGIGYHPDRRIIAYDDEGGGWAGKLLWVLDVIGHKHWAYLN
ncbi:MAG: rhodanese-like domain-containing protein, partial [Pseudomonadota bacterium]|nr:rhodanese-like domain-containing protein [Pseudomonadota bacterium]